jgi:hypothetical protein
MKKELSKEYAIRKIMSYKSDNIFFWYLFFVFFNTLVEGTTLFLYKIDNSNIDDYLFVYLFLFVPIHMFIIYCLKFQAIDKGRWYFACAAPLIFGSSIIDSALKPDSPSTFDIHPSIVTLYDCYFALPILILLSFWIMLTAKKQ